MSRLVNLPTKEGTTRYAYIESSSGSGPWRVRNAWVNVDAIVQIKDAVYANPSGAANEAILFVWFSGGGRPSEFKGDERTTLLMILEGEELDR